MCAKNAGTGASAAAASAGALPLRTDRNGRDISSGRQVASAAHLRTGGRRRAQHRAHRAIGRRTLPPLRERRGRKQDRRADGKAPRGYPAGRVRSSLCRYLPYGGHAADVPPVFSYVRRSVRRFGRFVRSETVPFGGEERRIPVPDVDRIPLLFRTFIKEPLQSGVFERGFADPLHSRTENDVRERGAIFKRRPRRSCSYRGTRTSRAALALTGRAALGKARKSRRTDVRRLCLFVALSIFPLNAECTARQRFYSALVYVRRRLTISRSNTSHCACTARLVTSSGLDSTCSI